MHTYYINGSLTIICILNSDSSGQFGISFQFPVPTENPVVSGLSADGQATMLGQHFIRVLNRALMPEVSILHSLACDYDCNCI